MQPPKTPTKSAADRIRAISAHVSPSSRSNATATNAKRQPGEPIRVCVTGAAGQIAYSLLYMIAHGDVFGKDQKVALHLLDIAPAENALKGVCLELDDCALPLLTHVVPTTDPLVAFKDVDWAIMLGAMPRREGMQRVDLLRANVGIFKEQGEALDKVAKKTVRVVVVGNPANTNALVAAHYAPSIPPTNFSALTRLDENRAKSLIAHRANVPVDAVRNVCVWGNHSNTQFPCVDHGHVIQGSGSRTPITQAVPDVEYLRGAFVSTVAMRGSAVIAARKLSSAMSAAKAVADHVRDWFAGTQPGEFVSMAVMADSDPRGTAQKEYGVPRDLCFSVPVTIDSATGAWSVVPGLQLGEFARGKLRATAQELEEERAEALAHIQAHADEAARRKLADSGVAAGAGAAQRV